jgi:hypothetical protein
MKQKAMNGIVLVLVLSFATILDLRASEAYTRSMFLNALREDSTSPLFVLINLRDSNSGVTREVCTLAPFLLGAIEAEYGLAASDDDKELLRRARATVDRTFSFSRPGATRRVRPEYTVKELEEIRDKLKNVPVDQLKAQLRANESQLHNMYLSKGRHGADAYKYALAHVLLSRGILVGEADVTGRLFTR